MVLGKNIIVAGCFGKIGRSIVTKLAENGANVIACAYKVDADFEIWCEKVAKEYLTCVQPFFMVGKDEKAIEETFEKIKCFNCKIDGFIDTDEFNTEEKNEKTDVSYMEEVFGRNVFLPLFFAQQVGRHMQTKKINGSIVFTTAVAALDGGKLQMVYGSSKAAMIGAMRCMAMDLGEYGIRVNAVCAGITNVLKSDDEMLKILNLPRAGKCEEVADTYMFLVSELSSHVTGQILRVDGGMR